VNAEWHRAHVLGQHAGMDERVAWHQEHAVACGCRPIPAPVQAVIDARARTDGDGE
jgi:hypothetical protein